jgi:hypothetical protein
MWIHAHKIGTKVPHQNLPFHFPPIHMLIEYFFLIILLSDYKNGVHNHMPANLEGTNNIYKNGTMANIHFKATFGRHWSFDSNESKQLCVGYIIMCKLLVFSFSLTLSVFC